MNHLLNIEKFYDDPDRIRKEALSFNYQSASESGGNWPGVRSQHINVIAPHIFKEFLERIYSVLGWPPHKTSYFETQFQICKEGDGNSWIHQDDFHEFTHVGIIYLHPTPPPDSGTLTYSLKPEKSPLDKGFKGWTHSKDNSAPEFYNIKERIQNVYNSAILYDPAEWHKSDTYFGDTLENSRLTQVCFFREDNVHAHHANPPGDHHE